MDKQHARDIIACRCAQEFRDGYVVNLGLGIPTQCAKFFPKDMDITLHAELGLIGQGPSPSPETADPLHITDAGGAPASIIPGGAILDSATSFGLIRGGHVDACVLGALEADEEGSFGNWLVPGRRMTGMGGAMDLVNGAKTVILAMTHMQGDTPKIVKRCTLPLTGYRVVDLIVTEKAVLRVTPEGLRLEEYNPELGEADAAVRQIRACTGAELLLSPALKPMILPVSESDAS